MLDNISLILSDIDGDYFRGKSILVTGGAGFIGSWISEALLTMGAKVTILDNLSTGNLNNIINFRKSENFRFINADVSSFKINEKFDYIIHAASIPSPEMYIEKPVDTMLPSSVGMLNILEAGRRYNSRILYISTSEVYGDSDVIPTPESYWGRVNPLGVRSCYDESKRFGEALCMAYYRQYDIDVRIARLFNTYGPRMDTDATYARVIPRFIIQALKNIEITVHGDGSQTRSFCYITDAANALLRLLTIDKSIDNVFNIGGQDEVKIIDLARLIKELTNSPSPIIFTPSRPDDPRRRCPDISKAIRILRWRPKIMLEDGLKYTIEWFKGVVIG